MCPSLGVARGERCEMNTPGFNADLSVGPTTGKYRGNAAGRSGEVAPMSEKQRSCTTPYSGYVAYPMSVCSGCGDLVRGLDWQTVAASPRELSAATPNAESRVSRFCRLSSGSWFAQLRTTESCVDSMPALS